MSELSETKTCSRCQEVLPRGAFARDTSPRDGLPTCCRKCSVKHFRQRREAAGISTRERSPVPPGLSRRAGRGRGRCSRRASGTTVEERRSLVESRFTICPIRPKPRPEHVDHDHQTGRVRGVLCFNCNSAMGKLRDDPDTMRRAIAYVEGNEWKPTPVAPGVYLLPS